MLLLLNSLKRDDKKLVHGKYIRRNEITQRRLFLEKLQFFSLSKIMSLICGF